MLTLLGLTNYVKKLCVCIINLTCVPIIWVISPSTSLSVQILYISNITPFPYHQINIGLSCIASRRYEVIRSIHNVLGPYVSVTFLHVMFDASDFTWYCFILQLWNVKADLLIYHTKLMCRIKYVVQVDNCICLLVEGICTQSQVM